MGMISLISGGREGFYAGEPQPPIHHAISDKDQRTGSGSRQEKKKFGQGRMALNTNCEDRTEPTKLHCYRSMDQKNGRQNSARSNCIKIQYRYMAEV